MIHLPVNTFLQGGKYRIVRFISSGGFGCTYEVEHVMLHKHFAIKEFFIKDFCNRDEETHCMTVATKSKTVLINRIKQKFIDEAVALSNMNHPNIVQVTDVFEENGTVYYVMDYIEGLSLNDVVKKKGPLSEEKVMKYIFQVCNALQYLHSRNRLHLDLKPSNIMIDGDDRAILIDFGASKQYDEENGENTSTLLGRTPGYAPLEQMGNDVVKFTPATDIYALGATLYKLLTGITPLGANLLACGEKLPPLSPSISVQTRNAIAIAMNVNKTNRPQSIHEFAGMLKKEPMDGNPKKLVPLVQKRYFQRLMNIIAMLSSIVMSFYTIAKFFYYDELSLNSDIDVVDYYAEKSESYMFLSSLGVIFLCVTIVLSIYRRYHKTPMVNKCRCYVCAAIIFFNICILILN